MNSLLEFLGQLVGRTALGLVALATVAVLWALLIATLAVGIWATLLFALVVGILIWDMVEIALDKYS